MEIQRIDHYSIRTLDLEASRRFYTDILGFKVGPRPAFDFPGLWLYNGAPPASLDEARGNYGIVHIIGVDLDNPQGLIDYLGDAKLAESGTGTLDHVALAGTGRDAMAERCRRHGVPFFERSVPKLGIHQLFLRDPSGVTIELNYPASEAPPQPAPAAASA
jgi:catechol 2,3-dioxygenase-like lactoylglutathione lyase family enzyme